MNLRNQKLRDRKEFVIIDRRKPKANPDTLLNAGKKISKISNITKNKIPKKLNKIVPLKKENEKDKKELTKLANLTKDTLFSMKSVFPFDLFPNKVIIEKKQIVLVYRQFFWTSQEYHVLIEDMLMPIVEFSPFFATLRLELGPGAFQQNPPVIKFLKRNEAKEAKLLITGLLICNKEKIDITNLKNEDIIKKAEKIGDFKDS